MSQTVLLGASGMLGRAFAEALSARRVAFSRHDLPDLDLERPETLDAVVTFGVTRVINCAAYTDVDGAETDAATADRINGDAVAHLAQRAADVGATLVHFSTDYVFSGEASTPYPPDAPLDPVNAYGRSKALGEEGVRRAGDDHLLVRTSWLYAPWGENFVLTMRRLGRERDALRVVDDQRGRPTEARHLARTTLALLDARARGTFHVTDGGECTWYELAKEVLTLSGSPASIAPCSSAEFPRPARRPRYSVLDVAATEALVGPVPRWRDNVASVLRT